MRTPVSDVNQLNQLMCSWLFIRQQDFSTLSPFHRYWSKQDPIRGDGRYEQPTVLCNHNGSQETFGMTLSKTFFEAWEAIQPSNILDRRLGRL